MQKFDVTYEGDEDTVHTYNVRPRHLVRFEKQYGAFQDTVTDVYRLAHIASGVGGKFDDWIETVAECVGQRDGVPGGADAEVGPTTEA